MVDQRVIESGVQRAWDKAWDEHEDRVNHLREPNYKENLWIEPATICSAHELGTPITKTYGPMSLGHGPGGGQDVARKNESWPRDRNNDVENGARGRERDDRERSEGITEDTQTQPQVRETTDGSLEVVEALPVVSKPKRKRKPKAKLSQTEDQIEIEVSAEDKALMKEAFDALDEIEATFEPEPAPMRGPYMSTPERYVYPPRINSMSRNEVYPPLSGFDASVDRMPLSALSAMRPESRSFGSALAESLLEVWAIVADVLVGLLLVFGFGFLVVSLIAGFLVAAFFRSLGYLAEDVWKWARRLFRE